MKRILFPTDFSKAAHDALPFAIDLANRFGAQLTLLHAYQVHTTGSTFVDISNYIVENVTEDISKWLEQITPQLENGATVHTKILRAKPSEAIANIASENAFDLIVMGTKGAENMIASIIGTHTNAVLKNTALPVLVIPEGAEQRPFQTIVLAVDEIEEFNVKSIKPLVTIAQSYASMVRVYHKDEANDGLNTAIDTYLEGIDRSYHYELDTDNLIDSLNEFVEEYDADLLCMIRRQRTFLENVFHDSATSQEAFSAKIPLLLLHDF